ncbi:hemerythrin domain-containing protein [Reyranella sp.]|uniref:hemerythrin domain-containing protein n=1 Tax=Reyranella sp. TaxID=1929291 RepID=UPI003D0EFD9C
MPAHQFKAKREGTHMSTTQDAIALLKADHRNVEALFEKFETTRDETKKVALVREICTELTVHASIEEKIFYPACNKKVEEEMLDEAYVEHDGAKVLIAELSQGSPKDEFYDAKVKVLSELIKHHVKEEEQPKEGIFAQAREADVDLVALGARLKMLKEELLADLKNRSALPPPETRSFAGHKMVQGKPVADAKAS